MTTINDISVLRDLSKRVAEIANNPKQEIRRGKWRNQNSLLGDEPLIYIRAFAFDEIFDERKLHCTDPLFRHYEKQLHEALYRDTFEDDFIIEPWITVNSIYNPSCAYRWGLKAEIGEKPAAGGAAAYTPTLKEECDFNQMTQPQHCIDFARTNAQYWKLQEAIGDILTVNLNQGPMMFVWTADISTDLAKLRGLEQIMWDSYDRPEFLHKLATFMSNGVLGEHRQTAEQGHWGRANSENQAMAYANELQDPSPNAYHTDTKNIWGYLAAQEFTGFSGEMFNEFILQYQIPILEQFGLSAYGCCEDLTDKIPYLRKIKNLRRIAVSPFANVQKCAEQIGRDYVASYRPNPSSMVSRGIDEDFIRREMRTNFALFGQNNCKFDITLKDVETVNHDPNAIAKWVRIVREEIDRFYR